MNPFLTPLRETVGSNVRICDVHPSLSKCLRSHQCLLPFPAATSTWPSYSRWCKTSPGKGKLAGRRESKARRTDFFFLYPSDKSGGGNWARSGPFWGSAREMTLGKWWRNNFIRSTCEEVSLCPPTWQGKCSLGSWALLPDSRLVHDPLHFISPLLLSSAHSWGSTGTVLARLWVGAVGLNYSTGL